MTAGMRVLIAGGSVLVRRVVALALGTVGFESTETKCGLKALDLMGQRRYRLLIIDVQMVDRDFVKLVQKVRRCPDCSSVPILLLVDRNTEERVGEAMAVGASAWVNKPFSQKALLESVWSLLD